jgi:hypothetical protein
VRKSRAIAVLAVGLLALPVAASAHQGDPNYRSEVAGVRPAADGVSVRALGFDDRLEIVNRSGRTVVIRGYEGEAYARLLGDGTVQVNLNSPAYYVNGDRFGKQPVPASAGAGKAPRWKTLDRTGVFEWHDHRAHWMGTGKPPQVADESRRTRIFDYRVPLGIDGRPAAVVGTLYWVGSAGGEMPLAAVAALAFVVVAGIAAVMAARRRNRPS